MQFWVSAAALAGIVVAALVLVSVVPVANFYLTGAVQLCILVATAGLLAHNWWRSRQAQGPEASTAPGAKVAKEQVCPERDVERSAGKETSADSRVVTTSGEAGAVAVSARPRLDYLDNLKAVLTAVVVVHHVTCCFSGQDFYLRLGAYENSFFFFGMGLCALDQSYFMALFFFISGYFTPGSYDRKGPRSFLVDKVWRLGLPFLAYLYGLGPAAVAMSQLFAESPVSYIPSSGPPWFVAWLLLFNAAYCSLGNPGLLPAPGLGRLLLWGCGIGMIQYLLMLMVGSTFVMMPLTFGSLPFDILFFGCGCAAKRNQWLEQVPLSSWGGRVLYPLAGLLAAALVAATVVLTGDGSILSPDMSTWPLWVKVLGGANVLIFGSACTVLSLAAVQLFKSHLNVTGPRCRLFAQAAYGAYLIHPVVVVPLVGAYVSFLRAQGEDVEFPEGSMTSSSRLSHDGWLWLGWAGTCALSVGIVFPLAAGLRRLPVLRDIL